MATRRIRRGPVAESGSRNVYADLGIPDAAGALVKARLVSRIAAILDERGMSQVRAAVILGIPQPKLSRILNGDFHGVSERRLMDCLMALGNDVTIVVRPARRGRTAGRVSVEFA